MEVHYEKEGKKRARCTGVYAKHQQYSTLLAGGAAGGSTTNKAYGNAAGANKEITTAYPEAEEYYRIASEKRKNDFNSMIDSLYYSTDDLSHSDLVYMKCSHDGSEYQTSLATNNRKQQLKDKFSNSLSKAEAIALVYVYLEKQKNDENNTVAQIYEVEFTQQSFDDLLDKMISWAETTYANQECPQHNCTVHREITTYIIFDDNQQPFLKEPILRENQQFKEFIHDYKPKVVYVDYNVYNTDEKLDNSMQPETFESIINSNATFYSQGELTVENKSKAVKKRQKSAGKLILICCLCALLAGGGGVLGGYKLFNSTKAAPSGINEQEAVSEGGMIIPEQVPIEPDAEQITISIDRSYMAIPTEDLELKGAIVDGKAAITLPEFDKTDFFTHVSGYTWGFSSVPDGKKIEYYGGQTYNFTENKRLYRVLVKYGGGSGTKEDPYLIDYYDQLELMASEEARGYFKQTNDISFPEYASHTPIDTVNELKSDPDSERFEYDGNGYVIDNLDNPLFGKISGATIKNVNLRNVVIQTDIYKDYGAIVCNAYNYQYRTNNSLYQTGETLIKHCSVAHASIIIGTEPETEETTEQVTGEVVPPDLIEYDENGKVIEHDDKTKAEKVEPTKMAQGYSIGCISGNGGQIEDCYVEDAGISVYADDYILNVGGISGKPANVLNSVVYNYSANGNIFNAGGIVGSAAGSRMYDAKGLELPDYYGGNIQGCVARMVWFNNEVAAGGIAGVGGSDAQNPVISNCYAMDMYFNCGEYTKDSNHTLVKEGICGGIIGTEGAFQNGHLVTNTVSVAEKLVIGKKAKSKYDETVRQAPDYAFYQGNILTVINSPTINPDNPKEIFTGIFKFDNSDLFGDSEKGALSYPETLEDLFAKTIMEESTNG